MRRGWPVAAALLGLLVAGCGRPPGVDGSLVNNWPPFPSATFAAANVGACYDGTGAESGDMVLPAAILNQVDCASQHVTETVHAGRYTGDAAQLAQPPDPTTPPGRQAYGACGTAANAYLGGDWHAARVDLIYVPPTRQQWSAGDRYYRCDLSEVSTVGDLMVRHTGSVRDGLRGSRPLAITCGLIDYGTNPSGGSGQNIDDVTMTGCTTPHDAEFAGVYTAGGVAYPSSAQWQNVVDQACAAKVPPFLDLSLAALAGRTDLSCVGWFPTQDRWQAGDRSVRCWVTVEGGRMVHASLRGLGSRPLPY